MASASGVKAVEDGSKIALAQALCSVPAPAMPGLLVDGNTLSAIGFRHEARGRLQLEPADELWKTLVRCVVHARPCRPYRPLPRMVPCLPIGHRPVPDGLVPGEGPTIGNGQAGIVSRPQPDDDVVD